eukprot:scaffold44_cov411-Prasinococcus_capsulatus_cf.AAC.46
MGNLLHPVTAHEGIRNRCLLRGHPTVGPRTKMGHRLGYAKDSPMFQLRVCELGHTFGHVPLHLSKNVCV